MRGWRGWGESGQDTKTYSGLFRQWFSHEAGGSWKGRNSKMADSLSPSPCQFWFPAFTPQLGVGVGWEWRWTEWKVNKKVVGTRRGAFPKARKPLPGWESLATPSHFTKWLCSWIGKSPGKYYLCKYYRTLTTYYYYFKSSEKTTFFFHHLRNIILSVVTRGHFCFIFFFPLMWNPKRNDTQMKLLTKQRLTDLENEFMVAGRTMGEGIVREFGWICTHCSI